MHATLVCLREGEMVATKNVAATQSWDIGNARRFAAKIVASHHMDMDIVVDVLVATNVGAALPFVGGFAPNTVAQGVLADVDHPENYLQVCLVKPDSDRPEITIDWTLFRKPPPIIVFTLYTGISGDSIFDTPDD